MIYLDGQYLPEDQAKVSVFDHGLLYGDGVFEGIRSYDGLVFCMDEHLDRLYNSADFIELKIPISKSEFSDVIVEVLKRNSLISGYIRPVVTRGVGDLGLNPTACPKATIFVIADTLTLYPKKCYENGLEVAIIDTVRNHHKAISPRIKSLNYLNNILGRLEVNRLGVGEGIMLNSDGNIGEATADNLFLVKDRCVFTPEIDHGALPGITRGSVMELAKKDGLTVVEKALKPEDLYSADECFLTGTGAEVIPVRVADGKPIGTGKPGKITLRLIELFKELTTQRGRRYTL